MDLDKDKLNNVGEFLIKTGNYIKVAGGLIGDLFENPSKGVVHDKPKKSKEKMVLLTQKKDK